MFTLSLSHFRTFTFTLSHIHFHTFLSHFYYPKADALSITAVIMDGHTLGQKGILRSEVILSTRSLGATPGPNFKLMALRDS